MTTVPVVTIDKISLKG
jgi:hypothetical protein